MIQGTKIEAAFVSTNSVSQGAQVPILWSVLLNDYNVSINFAHQTFKWNNESFNKKGGISVETEHIFPIIKKWL